jgi:predicted acylesterase/phospholipase RssA
MHRRPSTLWILLILLPGLAAGCLLRSRDHQTPTTAGIQTNDIIDPVAQPSTASQVPARTVSATKDGPSVLCLSGGGAYGAYTVGVLYGWSCRGDRPCFDVVTGVSTGALIAPFAFLGSSYDPLLRDLYTTVESRDIYRLRPLTGVFSEAFASNRPLSRKIDEMITPEMMQAIAREHARGRRLYLGTTEMEGHRFVVWDIGAIASRGRAEDHDLIRRILLASSALPGIFPPVRIPVTVNGQPFEEMHVDGSVSQSVFYQPSGKSSAGSVYVIVAGKLYADAEESNPKALSIAIGNLQAFSYAHTRGDIYRIWCQCNQQHSFQLAAIPGAFPAPRRITDFNPEQMTPLFQEGVRQMTQGTAWRNTPPGQGAGEETLIRSGTDLMVVPRTQGLVLRRE